MAARKKTRKSSKHVAAKKKPVKRNQTPAKKKRVAKKPAAKIAMRPRP